MSQSTSVVLLSVIAVFGFRLLNSLRRSPIDPVEPSPSIRSRAEAIALKDVTRLDRVLKGLRSLPTPSPAAALWLCILGLLQLSFSALVSALASRPGLAWLRFESSHDAILSAEAALSATALSLVLFIAGGLPGADQGRQTRVSLHASGGLPVLTFSVSSVLTALVIRTTTWFDVLCAGVLAVLLVRGIYVVVHLTLDGNEREEREAAMFRQLARVAAREVFVERAGSVLWHAALAESSVVSYASSPAWARRRSTHALEVRSPRDGFVLDIDVRALDLLERALVPFRRTAPALESTPESVQAPAVSSAGAPVAIAWLLLDFGQEVTADTRLAVIDIEELTERQAVQLAQLAVSVFTIGPGPRSSTQFEYLIAEVERVCREALERRSRDGLLRGVRLLLELVRAHLALATQLGARMDAAQVAMERQLLLGELPIASAAPRALARLLRQAAEAGDEEGFKLCAVVPGAAARLALEYEDHLVFDAFMGVFPSVFYAVHEVGHWSEAHRDLLLRLAASGLRDQALVLGERVEEGARTAQALLRTEEAWLRLHDAITEVLRRLISLRDPAALSTCRGPSAYVSGRRLRRTLGDDHRRPDAVSNSAGGENPALSLPSLADRRAAAERITMHWQTSMLALLGWLDYIGTPRDLSAEPGIGAQRDDPDAYRACARIILSEFAGESASSALKTHLAAARRDDQPRPGWDGWMLEGLEELVAHTIDFMPYLQRGTVVRLICFGDLNERPGARELGVDEGGRHVLEQLRATVELVAANASLAWIDLSERVDDVPARCALALALIDHVIASQRAEQAGAERSLPLALDFERKCQRELSREVLGRSTAVALLERAGTLVRQTQQQEMPVGSRYVATWLEKRWVVGPGAEQWNRERIEAYATTLVEAMDFAFVTALQAGGRVWTGAEPGDLSAACREVMRVHGSDICIICCDALGLGRHLWHYPNVIMDGAQGGLQAVPGFRGRLRVDDCEVPLIDVYPPRTALGFTLVVPKAALGGLRLSTWLLSDPSEAVVARCRVADLAVDDVRRAAIMGSSAQVQVEPGESREDALRRCVAWDAWVHFSISTCADSGVLVLSDGGSPNAAGGGV